MENEKHVIVLVDDEEDIAAGIADYINGKYSTYFTAHAIHGEQGIKERAIAKVDETNPILVVMDLVLNGIDGVDLIQLMLKTRPDLGVIFLTGCPKRDSLRVKADATGFPTILKPCSGRDVIERLKETLLGEN